MMNIMRYSLFVLSIGLLCMAFSSIALAEDPLSHEDAFVADDHPDVTALFEGREDSQKIIDALVDAGGNWRNLYEAIKSFDGDRHDDCIFLVKIMPHLDRLEMTKDTLVEHVEYAWKVKVDFNYSIPEEMFREYILIYRLGDEPVTPYRKLIRERFGDFAGDTPSDTALAVNNWVYENIEIKPRGFFGPRPSPVNVLNAGVGTEEDVANLTVAMLKTLGVPSRRVRVSNFGEQAGGTSWVEIYDDRWVPLYPDSPDEFGDFNHWEQGKPQNITVVSAQSAFHTAQVTPSYTETGVIELKFFRRGQVQPNFEHFGISVYNDGAWYPLDDLGFDLEESRMATDEEDIFEAVLGDGTYLVQCGVRNYKGDPWIQTKMVELKVNDRVRLEFQLDPPLEDLTRADLQRRKIKNLPEFILGGTTYPDDLIGVPHMLVFFNLKNEPSIRMLPDIFKFAYENNQILMLIHSGEPDDKKDLTHENGIRGLNLSSQKEEIRKAVTDAGGEGDFILWDDSGDVAELWKCPRDEEGNFTAFPATILVDEEGKVVLYDDGYNLMIYDLLLRALEFIKEY